MILDRYLLRKMRSKQMKDKLYVLIDTSYIDIVPLAVSYNIKRIYEIIGEKVVSCDYPTNSLQIIEIDLKKAVE